MKLLAPLMDPSGISWSVGGQTMLLAVDPSHSTMPNSGRV